ncbi:VWA domain-containing protein [Legionella sp. 16cNR16C]|uniref:vWA domain-containing protein n=1 Tax=Legionella sp. 16cNR16C TaxID=2905656 RepID=UPI001E5F339F|nr:vWA domain-containing protein [Legionella sp. 16cNR16C]MCE3045298.1 VWA domain-containing protein [Legionella sp. 16cNR16C]
MPNLSNAALRENSLREFLSPMGIKTDDLTIKSVEGVFSFEFPNPQRKQEFSESILNVLNGPGEKNTLKTIKIADIIAEEIENATADPEDKEACEGLFSTLRKFSWNASFSKESGFIEMKLPKPAYAGMFKLLKYPNLSISDDGKIRFDIKKYIKSRPEPLIAISDLNTNQDMLLLNSAALEANRVFYATKPLDDGNIEATPYFFVPSAVVPPLYRIVLDISSSMASGKRMEGLKKSVNELAQQLFEFQPNARIKLTTFSDGIHELGTYGNNNLNDFLRIISSLQTKGDTPLYETTIRVLNEIRNEPGCNNVLLFTDGENCSFDYIGLFGHPKTRPDQVSTALSQFGPENAALKARNKFYILSFGVEQDPVMKGVVETFKGQIININSADFLAALKDPQIMRSWAATRGLFTTVVKVAGKNNEAFEEYIDLSGQLHSLKPQVCKPGDEIELSVTDSENKVIIHSTQTIGSAKAAEKKDSPSVARLLSGLGLNPAPNAQTVQPTEPEITTPAYQ